MPAFDVPKIMDYYQAVRDGTTEYFANEMQESDLTIETNPPSLRSNHLRMGPRPPTLRRGRAPWDRSSNLRGMMRGLDG